jgi:REP element-mobilizing transposase RayT
MARRPREDVPHSTHHVCNRALDGRTLFADEEDAAFFRSLLTRWCRELGIQCLGWCMPRNHVHLLLARGDHSIAAFMRNVMGTYAAYFNRKHGRVGHVVQRRYESRRIEDDGDLRWMLAYVVGNSARHGLCPAASLCSDTRSGFAGAMGVRAAFEFEAWETALLAFDDDVVKARDALRELIVWAEANQWRRRRPDLDVLVADACARHRVDRARLTAKTPAACAARREVAWRAKERLGLGATEISAQLGVSRASLGRALLPPRASRS